MSHSPEPPKPTRPAIANKDEVAPTETAQGRHQFTRRALGAAAGGRQLGCSHMILPPGAVSFPLHFHAANEEAIYVLAGRGTLRLGEAADCLAVRPGDWIALPCGPAHAHQLVNDGDAPLEYLCVSTMIPVDVWVYPDSGKIGLGAAPPGGGRADRYLTKYFRAAADVDYWDGEPAALPSAEE
jgi:uncharacterized cupin superfamily protein